MPKLKWISYVYMGLEMTTGQTPSALFYLRPTQVSGLILASLTDEEVLPMGGPLGLRHMILNFKQ